MKNKLYFIMFPAYFVVVVVILALNGVFTGGPIDLINLGINAIILAIMGVCIVLASIGFGKANRFTSELINAAEKMQKDYRDQGGKSLWGDYQEKKDVFRMEPLKLAYAKYRMRMKNFKTKRGYSDSCDIDEYINEELLDRVAGNHMHAALPGMFTGLGILGTFLGLSIGLGSFNGSDIYAVTDNVGTLLGGMKVAFHTSVYGIFFSLLFGLVHRSIMDDAYEKLEIFHHVFRQCVVPPVMNEDENSSAMLVYQANTANAIRELVELTKGSAAIQVAGAEQIVSMCMEKLALTLHGNLTVLGESMQANAEAQTAYLQACGTLLEQVSTLIANNKEAQDSMRTIISTQKQLGDDLARQGKEIEETCREISADISNQLYTFDQMRTTYEK